MNGLVHQAEMLAMNSLVHLAEMLAMNEVALVLSKGKRSPPTQRLHRPLGCYLSVEREEAGLQTG